MMKGIVEKTKASMFLIDPFFVIQEAIANSITGERCEGLMTTAVQHALPHKDHHLEPELAWPLSHLVVLSMWYVVVLLLPVSPSTLSLNGATGME